MKLPNHQTIFQWSQPNPAATSPAALRPCSFCVKKMGTTPMSKERPTSEPNEQPKLIDLQKHKEQLPKT